MVTVIIFFFTDYTNRNVVKKYYHYTLYNS